MIEPKVASGIRARALKFSVPLLGVLGIGGLIGFLKSRSRFTKRRPTADELMKMSDADFAAFIHASGLLTVTTAGLATPEAHAD
ncbi:MAG TPA: hypothetical protein VNF73_12455 [Candidatus Saccharimonadales bacterium]|nr:hypothetical protein [Candidatus Saccharimonadales bacterium]